MKNAKQYDEPKDVTGWFFREKALLRSFKSLHFSCQVINYNYFLYSNYPTQIQFCIKHNMHVVLFFVSCVNFLYVLLVDVDGG